MAPEIGCQYNKRVLEIDFGHVEYFITASGTWLYSPKQDYSMNYVQGALPYVLNMKSNTALYGSVSLGAKLATLSNWSMGLMGRVDMSRFDTIYRAMAYVKKSF